MQEHWLHSYEKYIIQELLPDFTCHVKSFDDNKIIDPMERTRGHGGVAICIKRNLEHLTEQLLDGWNRVVISKLKLDKPVLLVCIYLPTRGNLTTNDDYQAILDELVEILEKYKVTCDIILVGDMNASLHREGSLSRDKIFRNFLDEANLFLPKNCKKRNTFHHYNGKDESQIDYFLQNKDLITTYVSFEREPCNTSTHDPVMALLPVNLTVTNIQNNLPLKTQYIGIKWINKHNPKM